MTAPERIWASYRKHPSQLYAYPWRSYERSDETEYIRADLIPAALAVPEVRALVEAAKSGLRFIENTEGELGIVLGCGDALRAALAALRGEGRG